MSLITRQERFKKERDAILLTFDLVKIKRFYKKYRDLLMFPYLPPDYIVYKGAMLDILEMEKATSKQKKRARAWLDEHRHR